MSTSSQSGPDDRDDGARLSAWEQRVLADIEGDLVSADPRLAREMSPRQPNGRGPRAALRWWPLTARSTALLFVALSVLVLAGALVPPSWWAVLALVTTLVVVPWLLLAAIEKNRSE